MPSRIVRSGLGLGFAVSESDGSEIKTGTSASSGTTGVVSEGGVAGCDTSG